MIHAGINLHSNNMVIVAINDNGEVVGESKLPNSDRALDDFFSAIDEPVQAVGSPTGPIGARPDQPVADPHPPP